MWNLLALPSCGAVFNADESYQVHLADGADVHVQETGIHSDTEREKIQCPPKREKFKKEMSIVFWEGL